jgi:hypothetical protein
MGRSLSNLMASRLAGGIGTGKSTGIVLPRQILRPHSRTLHFGRPISFDGGTNFYTYVKNGSPNYRDPYGLAMCVYHIAEHTLACWSSRRVSAALPTAPRRSAVTARSRRSGCLRTSRESLQWPSFFSEISASFRTSSNSLFCSS